MPYYYNTKPRGNWVNVTSGSKSVFQNSANSKSFAFFAQNLSAAESCSCIW